MLAYIKGTVEELGDGYVVLENQNIGYYIKTPASVISGIAGLHSQLTLYTYMYVREDEISLYGFASHDALNLFKQLITVSGVGPKVAVSILSALSEDALRMAIVTGDVKSLTKANGLGAKGAQRIIMELKDKITMEDALDSSMQTASEMSDHDSVLEASMALVALGYSQAEALSAIRVVPDAGAMDVELLIKQALKRLI